MLQVVQEYERAVIFRLGRLLNGGSKGPGNAAQQYPVELTTNLREVFTITQKTSTTSTFTLWGPSL